MAVDLLAHEVSDLCIGKPALRSLPPCATVGEALRCLKRCGDSVLAVWGDRKPPPAPAASCLGRVCMVDVICFLCSDAANIARGPSAALLSPLSVLLPDADAAAAAAAASICRVERHSSVVEALDVMLGGAQALIVPLRRGGGHKNNAAAAAFCWLTQEDFVRFFLSSIAAFSPVPALSVDALGIVRPDALAVRYHQPAAAALPLIREALASQTAVAVVTDDGELVGEISPSTLANCDETVAAAVAALTAGELMAYIDAGGLGAGPPEEAVRAVKVRLMERGMLGMLELIPADAAATLSDASLSSSSSEEESSAAATRHGRSGSYSARMGRRSEDAIVCHPWSSLVAVMIQALAHRVNYVWVVEDDYQLTGVVSFSDILTVFREQLPAGN